MSKTDQYLDRLALEIAEEETAFNELFTPSINEENKNDLIVREAYWGFEVYSYTVDKNVVEFLLDPNSVDELRPESILHAAKTELFEDWQIDQLSDDELIKQSQLFADELNNRFDRDALPDYNYDLSAQIWTDVALDNTEAGVFTTKEHPCFGVEFEWAWAFNLVTAEWIVEEARAVREV